MTVWAAAATVVVGAYSANKQAQAAKAGRNASQNATNQAIDQQNMNYDRSATNLNPYINAGTTALGQMQQVNNGDYSGFMNSPDYQFTQQQGLQGLDRSAAARGGLLSGGHSTDVMNYASGLASQQLGNYYSRLQGMTQMGANSASNLGSIGAGQSGAIGSYLQNNAQNQTSGYQNQANNQSQFANQLGGAFGQFMGNRSNANANPTASSYGNQSPYGYNNTSSPTLNGAYWGSGVNGMSGGGSYSLAGAGRGVG